MLCLVHYLFVISTSVIDCLGRFVPEMTYYVLSGTLNLTKLKLTPQGGDAFWPGGNHGLAESNGSLPAGL